MDKENRYLEHLFASKKVSPAVIRDENLLDSKPRLNEITNKLNIAD